MKLDRYETNLRVRNNIIYSYDTKVAIIHDEHIEVLGQLLQVSISIIVESITENQS